MTTARILMFAATLTLAGTVLAQELGETSFQTNCVACHQATGQGLPGAFPPLAGHVPDLLAAEGGRTYLIHVLLYGQQGEMSVDGQTYNGVMPPWAQLSDEELAAVLTHISTAWENEAALPEGFEPFTADEVASQRDLGLSGADVNAQREELLSGD
jgi:mono/diheme cytochrome c family protein